MLKPLIDKIRSQTHLTMWVVLAAMLPGTIAMTQMWGLGVMWNVAVMSAMCLGVEYLCVRATKRTLDGSAMLTAWILALCLPPFTDLLVLAVAAVSAVGLAKHAYGGLGRNLFNPAMVGYAVVLVSFPQSLVIWPSDSVDAFTGATLLTDFRYREGLTVDEFNVHFADAVGASRAIAFGFLLGGLALIYMRIIHWRLPLAMVIGIAMAGLVGYDQGSSESLGSLTFHLFAGGTVMAAFFVVTDPVTCPQAARDQWIFGILVGILIYAMRAFSAYPDGIAFAILLANCLSPLLDRYTLARSQRDSNRIPTVQTDD